ncbi:MAG TPA: hypothetical protein VHZ50_04455 [Puia sp.]|jgi:uncharacterized membrane protein|nr:hypothetical protein [Puia sp.]
MDEKLLWFNIFWLLFIVLLPFSTSLISTYFSDVPAMFIYCLNTLLIAIFQNNIWDYASSKPDFMKPDSIEKTGASHLRLFWNLEMINAIVALILCFFRPRLAFILLFTKLPTLLLAGIFLRREKRNLRKQAK